MPTGIVPSSITTVPISDVWERLGGGPLHHGRAVAFWRGGNSLNVSIDCDRNVWFDHARGFGGGVLRLVEVVQRCDRPRALRWCSHQGFIPDAATSSRERLRLAQKRARVNAAVEEVQYWRRARTAYLEKVKAVAVQQWKEAALADSAEELYRLQTDGEGVVALYRDHLQRDPGWTAALIEWAREDERDAEGVTAVVVLLLAGTGTE